METKNLNNEVKNAVKNNSKKFYAAMLNGNCMSNKDLVANVNKVNANLQINAEVANCEISETDSSHLKLSISLPWGGEAKLEWNGSTTMSSSVLAQKELAKIAHDEQELAASQIKGCIEYTIGRTVKFIQDELPQIKEAIEAVTEDNDNSDLTIEEKVKKEYYNLDYEWRHEYESYLRDQDDEYIAKQVSLAKVGVLNEVQLHLLDKAGALHKDTYPSNLDPIDDEQTTEAVAE